MRHISTFSTFFQLSHFFRETGCTATVTCNIVRATCKNVFTRQVTQKIATCNSTLSLCSMKPKNLKTTTTTIIKEPQNNLPKSFQSFQSPAIFSNPTSLYLYCFSCFLSDNSSTYSGSVALYPGLHSHM